MKKNLIGLLFLFGLTLGLSLPAAAQETQSDSGRLSRIPAGQKQKLRGVIVKREADSFILRDLNGVDVQVNLSNITKVEEKKGKITARPRCCADFRLKSKAVARLRARCSPTRSG